MIRLLRHLFSHSPFDVGRSMFDVHFSHSVLGKNNLALMAVLGCRKSHLQRHLRLDGVKSDKRAAVLLT